MESGGGYVSTGQHARKTGKEYVHGDGRGVAIIRAPLKDTTLEYPEWTEGGGDDRMRSFRGVSLRAMA